MHSKWEFKVYFFVDELCLRQTPLKQEWLFFFIIGGKRSFTKSVVRVRPAVCATVRARGEGHEQTVLKSADGDALLTRLHGPASSGKTVSEKDFYLLNHVRQMRYLLIFISESLQGEVYLFFFCFRLFIRFVLFPTHGKNLIIRYTSW